MNKIIAKDVIILCVALASLTAAAFDLKASLDQLAYKEQGHDEH